MALRSDEPPNSRLFILCQKGITEQEFREHFGEYGTIDDIWIVKDKRTNEDRGEEWTAVKGRGRRGANGLDLDLILPTVTILASLM